MSYMTYIFPITLLLLTAAFFMGIPELNICRLHDEDEAHRRFDRRDALLLAAICLVYAFTAFYGLGDRQAPESYHVFTREPVVIKTEKPTEVSSIRFYGGLNTGTYTLEFSQDGVEYVNAGSMEQNYVALFKWEQAQLDAAPEMDVSYIRISSDTDTWLGELAVYDAEGELVSCECAAAPELFDEQDKIPDAKSYLNSTYFDEIYHARTAFEHINGVYPYEISHPPLGKIIISLGILLFGMNPFGWRFMGTLTGVLMLPVMYLFLKKLFGGKSVPVCGTLIFAFDFMHYTQTRIATIDSYAVLFILLMYYFMYRFTLSGKRRELFWSGLFFGIGAACKWTCIYAGAGLAVIWLCWWLIEMLSKRKSFLEFLSNCLCCVLFFVVIPCCIYYASYYPYIAAQGMHGVKALFTREYLDTVVQNQSFMLRYHVGVTDSHPYSSRWYQWIFDIRPILYYSNYFDDGTRSSFGCFASPALCWGGLLAMCAMGYLAVGRGDRKAGFILAGYLAQLLPWLLVTRITFEYHYFPSTVFLVLALCYVFELMRLNCPNWRVRVYAAAILSVGLFVMFYPVLSGTRVSVERASFFLKWIPTWPF